MNEIKENPDQNGAPDKAGASKGKPDWEATNQGEARKGPTSAGPSGAQEANAKKRRNAAMDKRYLMR